MPRSLPRRTAVLLLAVLAGVAAGMMTTDSVIADPVFLPGSRIGLEPPKGVVAAKQFPGYEDTERKVAITILDLPGPAFDQLQRDAFSALPRGMKIEKREMFGFADGAGYLITGTTETEGVKVRRLILLASTSEADLGHVGTMINVQVPEAARNVYPDSVIRAALATVTFRKAPLDERLGLLPIKVGDFAGFRLMQVMPNGAILTDGPTDNLVVQPYAIIQVGAGPPLERDAREQFARDILGSAPVRDLNVTSLEQQRINGYPGIEVRARAKDLGDNPISMVQWIRFSGGGFLRVVGVARADIWDKEFPRFRAIRDGVEPK